LHCRKFGRRGGIGFMAVQPPHQTRQTNPGSRCIRPLRQAARTVSGHQGGDLRAAPASPVLSPNIYIVHPLILTNPRATVTMSELNAYG